MTRHGAGPLRVAHICPSFSPLSETFIYDKVQELERRGVEGTVVSFRRHLEGQRPFPRVVTPGTFPGLGLRLRRGLRLLSMDYASMLIREERSHRRLLGSLLDQAGPTDVMHAHFGSMGVLAAPLARARRVPLVVGFYGFDVGRLPRQAEWRAAYAALWNDTAAALVLSEQMASKVEKLGCPGERIRVVHLAAPREVERGEPAHPPIRWLSVGRLVEKKGHLDVIRAFARVAPEYVGVTLSIIGDGPLRQELEREVDRFGLTGRVRLLGSLPRAEVLAEMRRTDAFVLCSRTAASGDEEGTPTALIEAAAFGLPCISTWHAGIPEIVPASDHDLLVPEGDIDGIAEAMKRILSASREDLRKRSRNLSRHIRTHFDLGRETGKLVDVYRAVAGEGAL